MTGPLFHTSHHAATEIIRKEREGARRKKEFIHQGTKAHEAEKSNAGFFFVYLRVPSWTICFLFFLAFLRVLSGSMVLNLTLRISDFLCWSHAAGEEAAVY